MILNARVQRLTVSAETADGNPHRLNGHAEFFGVPHHVEFVRVKEGNMVEPFDDAPEDVSDQFRAMQEFYDGAYHRVTVPGQPGKWVMFVYPFAD